MNVIVNVYMKNGGKKSLGYAGTLVFDHPSVKHAAAHIHELLARKAGAMTVPSGPRALITAPPRSQPEAAIKISIASRLPYDFGRPNGFDDPVSTAPYDRWDLEAANKTGKSVTRARYGAWLQAVDLFDESFFGVSAPEAELMDPQQRLLLEMARQAAEACSYIPFVFLSVYMNYFWWRVQSTVN